MLEKYENKDILTLKEVKEVLRIGMNKLYNLLKTGELRSFKIGRVYKINKKCVIEYIERKSKESNKN